MVDPDTSNKEASEPRSKLVGARRLAGDRNLGVVFRELEYGDLLRLFLELAEALALLLLLVRRRIAGDGGDAGHAIVRFLVGSRRGVRLDLHESVQAVLLDRGVSPKSDLSG